MRRTQARPDLEVYCQKMHFFDGHANHECMDLLQNAAVSKSDFVHNYCKKATDGMNFYLKRGSSASFDAMHDGVTNQIIQSTPSGAPNTKCESNCTVSQDNYAVL